MDPLYDGLGLGLGLDDDAPAKMPQLDTALENKKKNVETREKCFKDFKK